MEYEKCFTSPLRIFRGVGYNTDKSCMRMQPLTPEPQGAGLEAPPFPRGFSFSATPLFPLILGT